MKKTVKISLLLTLALLLWASAGLRAQDAGPFKRGAGSFEYTGYGPLEDHPVTVFYYIPTKGNVKKMRVLFSMHGAERSGLTQRGAWRNLAEEFGFVVIAPQFVHKDGYLENGYQFGWVYERPDSLVLRPREKWAYAVIEPLFDYFRECTGSTAQVYDMFGHSAGGQFVHRYLLATPEARVGRAVAANAGNFTYPDERGLFMPDGTPAVPSGWPYSVKETPFAADEYLAPFFGRNLIILTGTEDTEPLGPGIAENHPVRAQGIHRNERAWKFFAASRDIALRKGMTFNWIIMEVPGAGHSSGQMIYGQGSVRNWRIENDERLYNNKDITERGAYSLIFER